jgi:hypothetical protein
MKKVAASVILAGTVSARDDGLFGKLELLRNYIILGSKLRLYTVFLKNIIDAGEIAENFLCYFFYFRNQLIIRSTAYIGESSF